MNPKLTSPAEPPSTPPVTPPATPPPEPVEQPVVDSFAQEILASIGKVVTPDGNIDDAEPVAPVEPPVRQPSSMTTGERLAENARLEKEAAANPTPPAEPDPAAPPAAPPVAPPAPAPVPKLTKKKPVVAAPLVVAALAPPAPAPVPPVVPPTPAADPDAAFISQLDGDQQAELETAKFAEDKFPEMKGRYAETLNFFKKVDEFARANPNAEAEALDQVITSNKPKWKPGEKRKVDTAFITTQATDAATKKVREEMQPQLQAAQKKTRELELKPVIDQAVTEFSDLMTSKESLPDDKMEALPADVSKRIAEVGYEAASKEFIIEAPIVAHTEAAAREWMKLSNGLVDYNPSNQLHAWLLNFVGHQGQLYAANPESTQNGRKFLPLMKHLELARTNPAEAQRAYTFSDKDVLNLLAVNANIAYNAKITHLEQAGFKREKKNPVSSHETKTVPPTPTPPTPAPTPAPSPRMKVTPQHGAGNPDPKPSENASFLDALVPGASNRIGVT